MLGKTLDVLKGSGTDQHDTEQLMANVSLLASGALAEDTAVDCVLTHYTRTGIPFHNHISFEVQRDEDADMIRPGVILKTKKASVLNMRARATRQLLRDAEAFQISDSSSAPAPTACDALFEEDSDLLRLTAPPKIRRGTRSTASSSGLEPITNSMSAVTLKPSKSPQPDDARSASLEGDIMSPNLDDKYLYEDHELDACIQDPQHA